MKYFIKVSILFISSFIFVSCASSKKISVNEISFEEILENTRANFEKIWSYSGNGTIEVNLKNIKINLQFLILAKKTSQALIDIYGPFEIDFGSIYLNDDSILFYNSMQNELIITSFSSGKLKNINFIAMEKKLIYSLLFGYFDQNSIVVDSVKLNNKENQFELIKFVEGRKLEFIYDKYSKFLSKIIFSENLENPAYEIIFSEVKSFNGISFPEKVEFLNLKTNENISLNFKKLIFNEIDDEIKLELPDDIEIIRW